MGKGKVKPTIEHTPKHKLYWFSYSTRSFDFDAFGKTEQKCLEHMISAWITHAVSNELDDEYIMEMIGYIKDDFYAQPIEDGVCYRDRDFDLLNEQPKVAMAFKKTKAYKDWAKKVDQERKSN